MAETAGWWKTGIADIRCDDQVVKETLIGMAKDDEIFIVWNQKASCWEFVGLPTIRGYGHGHLYDEPNDRDFQIVFGGTDDEVLFFKNLYSKDGKGIDVEVVRAVRCVAKAGEPYTTTSYVQRTAAEVATNTTLSIVTNEVAEHRWEWIEKEISYAEVVDVGTPRYIGEGFEAEGLEDPRWVVLVRGVDEYGISYESMDSAPGGPDATHLFFRAFGVKMRRVTTTRNALGLAMAKDVEKLPDHETVTNVARAVSNSFWDEKNSVLWRLDFRDGEPMFVPVTNENVKATGGVL
jgi:hypothetical protein